jgi:DNA-binding transcriptional regulator YiaG
LPFSILKNSSKKPFLKKYLKNPVTIGDHIRRKRIELGILQKDVAYELNVSEDTVTYWENNRAKPMINHMPAIIRFLKFIPLTINRESLSGKIKWYRYIHGLSYKAFGKLLQTDASTVSSWEKEKSHPQPIAKKVLEILLSSH